MDATRFDTLARAVTDGSSRRAALRGLVAVVTGTLAVGLSDAADARKKRKA